MKYTVSINKQLKYSVAIYQVDDFPPILMADEEIEFDEDKLYEALEKVKESAK